MLTDGKGRTEDFKNTLIIMTSYLGAEHLAEGMTGKKSMQAARNLVMEKVREIQAISPVNIPDATLQSPYAMYFVAGPETLQA